MSYIRNFLKENVGASVATEEDIRFENLIDIPIDALTPIAREFALEVFRVFSHPHAFDYGSGIAPEMRRGLLNDFGTFSFLMQVWAGLNKNSAEEGAYYIHKYRNLAYLYCRELTGYTSDKEVNLLTPISEVENTYDAREAYFLAYAVDAVADAWGGDSPLTSEQVERIANAAMEYAVKNRP